MCDTNEFSNYPNEIKRVIKTWKKNLKKGRSLQRNFNVEYMRTEQVQISLEGLKNDDCIRVAFLDPDFRKLIIKSLSDLLKDSKSLKQQLVLDLAALVERYESLTGLQAALEKRCPTWNEFIIHWSCKVLKMAHFKTIKASAAYCSACRLLNVSLEYMKQKKLINIFQSYNVPALMTPILEQYPENFHPHIMPGFWFSTRRLICRLFETNELSKIHDSTPCLIATARIVLQVPEIYFDGNYLEIVQFLFLTPQGRVFLMENRDVYIAKLRGLPQMSELRRRWVGNGRSISESPTQIIEALLQQFEGTSFRFLEREMDTQEYRRDKPLKCGCCAKLGSADEIKRCGGCKTIAFCGEIHQRYYWNHGHKQLCPLLKEMYEKLK